MSSPDRPRRGGLVSFVLLAVAASIAVVIVIDRALFSSSAPSAPSPPPPATTSTTSSEDEAIYRWIACQATWEPGWDPPNVAWSSECLPEYAEADLWWLATSQVLADGEADSPREWRSQLLAFCGWLDDLVLRHDGLQQLTGEQLRGLAPSILTAQVYADRGRPWAITAVAASDHYCPEHRRNLPPLRQERIDLIETVRYLQHRAAASLPWPATGQPVGPDPR